jgi:mannose-1-phosphate guanylyltransferase/mannose-6-phosphate isomerase
MFLLEVDTWLDAMQLFNTKMINFLYLSMDQYETDQLFIRPQKNYFNKISSNSIDYAVIEKLPITKFPLIVFRFQFEWTDLGNWNALSNLMKKDDKNNKVFGDYLDITQKIILSIVIKILLLHLVLKILSLSKMMILFILVIEKMKMH